MGKRSNFERRKNDQYYTPYKVVLPLLPFLPDNCSFVDLCAGNGALIRHFGKHGHKCQYASDIDPKEDWIEQRDFLFFGQELPACELFIMNPPWERELLHQFIDKCRVIAPAWLLFDADWMFTGQAKPFLKHCDKVVSVGRVSWMENGTSGMDNCAWYLFLPTECQTKFYNL